MSNLEIIALALEAVIMHSATIRLGKFTISASNNGAPVKFSLGAAITAIEEVLAGTTGSFQVGSTLITVQ